MLAATILVILIGLTPAMLVKAGQWRRARKARRARKDRTGRRLLALALLCMLVGAAPR